jgi:ABC-2 type transport system ATP-binding protein
MNENNQAPAEAIVTVENLHKVFKDFWGRPRAKAVNGIDFEIKRGEVFGLLGPNGSGKSTTIKMMLGLLHPTKGRIQILGKQPRDVKTKSRIGYLPEESYLYPYLTARETLDFYGQLFDLNGAERKQRIDQLLEMVGLQHTGRRTIKEFSKGMARRIGLAQALINNPEIVILDEPTSGLDPIGTRQVKDLIESLAQRGKTVLLSSHLLADVEDVCDRIIILYGGKIQAQGPIKDLLKVEDRYQIPLPSLNKEALQRVLSTLRTELGQDFELEHPSRNLEQYFIEVIQQARASGQEASGANSGGPSVAKYLSDDDDAPAEKSDVLEALTGEASTAAALPEEPAAEPPPAKPTKSQAEIDEKLKDLLGGDKPNDG